MEKAQLIKKMNEFISIKEDGLKERSVKVEHMTFENLRDSLIGLGTILDEDFVANTYIVNISAGVANMNTAIVAVQLMDDRIQFLSYAKEGLINQHTAESGIDKTVKRIEKYLVYPR